MVCSDTLLLLPQLPCPTGAAQAVTLLAVHPTYVQAATCVLWSASYLLPSLSLPCFFPSLRYVSQQRPFVSSVSLSAHHSPPAAHNFCVPFGLLRLRVCHTFCKEKKKQKDTPNPCVIRCCPTHSVLSGHPLSKRTPPSSVTHSIGFIPARFAFGGQVCHLGSTAFFGSGLFLPKTEERIMVFLFPFIDCPVC